jgi:ubiquinone/menaquinone biosynthesis C-methylase UbiE
MRVLLKKRILNIGCGSDSYGTDFVDLYPRRKEVKKFDSDIDNLSYKNNTFDLIICNYLFEHLTNHKHFLEECYRVLKKDGEIYLETDNASWFNFHNLKSKYKVHLGGYTFDGEESDDKHYALFTIEHIKNHFKKAGFKDIKVEPFRRDKMGWKINLIHSILEKTRFKLMSYPQIKGIVKK